MSDKTKEKGGVVSSLDGLVGFLKRRINCLRGKHEWAYVERKFVSFTCSVQTGTFECAVCGKEKIGEIK